MDEKLLEIIKELARRPWREWDPEPANIRTVADRNGNWWHRAEWDDDPDEPARWYTRDSRAVTWKELLHQHGPLFRID